MNTMSKVMAMAVLALVMGSAHAATTMSPTSTPVVKTAPTGAVVATITINSGVAGTYDVTSGIDFGAGVPLGNIVLGGAGATISGDVLDNMVTTVRNVAVAVTGQGNGAVGNFFVTNDTLTVTINVTLNVPIQVVLVDSTPSEQVTLTWTLALKTLNTTYTSAVAGTDPFVMNIRNKGQASVKIDASLTSTGNWVSALNPGTGVVNQFWVDAIGADNTQSLDNTAKTITNSIDPASPDSVTSLVFHTPSSVTKTSSGNIVVQFVATND